MQFRHAGAKRPISFRNAAAAKDFAKFRRRNARFSEDKEAARILIEAVHEARTLAILFKRAKHAIEMARLFCASLHGETEWLVNCEYLIVLVNRQFSNEIDISAIRRRWRSPRRGGALSNRRNADRLAGLDAPIRFRAPAIDAHLACAKQLFERAMAERRKIGPEPAVEPQPRILFLNRQCFNAAHRLVFLLAGATARPVAPATEAAS